MCTEGFRRELSGIKPNGVFGPPRADLMFLAALGSQDQAVLFE
jgi:hypothetical protein